jgi:hypothetical protein
MSSYGSLSLEKFARLIGIACLLAACGPAPPSSRAETVSFVASTGLGDFEFAATVSGAPGEWSVVRNEATQALAQTGTDATDDRFPLAIYRPFSGRNVYVSIRFMPVAGTVDQAGGVIARFTPAGDYYLARANALETTCASTAWLPASGR